MTAIAIVTLLILASIGSAFLVYFKEDADMTLTLNKGFLIGIAQMQTIIEDEKEVITRNSKLFFEYDYSVFPEVQKQMLAKVKELNIDFV